MAEREVRTDEAAIARWFQKHGLAAGRRTRRGLLASENRDGWLFASPWIAGFVLFTAGPMVASFVMGLMQWDLLSPPQFAGWSNYTRALRQDPLVWQALRITTAYALGSVPLQMVSGFSLALLLNTGVSGLRWYRTVYYMPAVLGGVEVSLLWIWVYQPQFGLANWMLSLVGIAGPPWLASQTWALPSLVIMSVWGVGQSMVIYLAGLQGVPTTLYEAASADGANWWGRFRHVTLPMVSPVLFFQLVMGIIGALQVFTAGYVMTAGGPNNATLFFVLHLYRNAFQYFKMGYACSLAWLLFLYVSALTLLTFRSSSAWVYYETELRT
ncbi:MAG: sugar ABC transporter permease [Anaerolineae bacterium]|nr:sugar ABC transporter permease [Anaerolineae bacterium]